MKAGLLIVVSRPGRWEGSVIKRARELTDNLSTSVSATSRKPRG